MYYTAVFGPLSGFVFFAWGDGAWTMSTARTSTTSPLASHARLNCGLATLTKSSRSRASNVKCEGGVMDCPGTWRRRMVRHVRRGQLYVVRNRRDS